MPSYSHTVGTCDSQSPECWNWVGLKRILEPFLLAYRCPRETVDHEKITKIMVVCGSCLQISGTVRALGQEKKGDPRKISGGGDGETQRFLEGQNLVIL